MLASHECSVLGSKVLVAHRVHCPGVWSGCAFPSEHGTILLHTAVREQARAGVALPLEGCDLGLEMIESQGMAIATPGRDRDGDVQAMS